jgi:uncharacterized SAM-binding protein YcdF (DUF218 family)
MLIVLVAVLSVGLVALTERWFVNPRSNVPNEQADVIVVLAGGDGERLERALELANAEVAPTLVLSEGNRKWPAYPAIAEQCSSTQPYRVVCIQAEIDDTKGEAQAFSELANAEGWESVVLVTSSYHLHRSRLRVESCFEGVVHPVAAPAPLTFRRLTHEWLGTAEAVFLNRGC